MWDWILRNFKKKLVGEGLGAVIVAGDFNAHVGCLGGPRGVGKPNQPGLIVKDFIDRCLLHVLSLSSGSEGQNYTFWNSASKTSVDYILCDYDDLMLYFEVCLT